MTSMRTTQESLDYLKKNFSVRKFTAPINSYFMTWLKELNTELTEQSEKVYNILETLTKSTEVHTVGKGRSYFAVRSTGTRLMHEGLDLYDVADPYTHAMIVDETHKPVLLAYSGSGQTKFVVTAARKARAKNVPIIGISSNIDSDLVRLAGEDNMIITKGKRIYPRDTLVAPESEEPINFLQTKSEFKALSSGELVANSLAKIRAITEADMRKRHNDNE